jgi:anti-anti-sigma regulatory factor
MRDVPLVDATALSTIEELAANCSRHGCRIIISGLQKQPRLAMHRMGTLRRHKVLLASNSYVALEKAKAMLEESRLARQR